MTSVDNIRRTDEAYYQAWRIIASAMDGGELRESDGLMLLCSGLPIAMFNMALVTRPLVDAPAQIAGAAAYFDARGAPFIVRVRETLDPAAERACEDAGMPYGDSVPGMIHPDASSCAKAVDGLVIRTMDDDATLADHRDVLVEGFGFGHDAARTFVPARLIEHPDITHFVGYIDGHAVATSASIVTQRVAGVWNVATRASHRGRGIGEAMTAHAARFGAALGADIAALQASEMGYPIYERMGFRLTQQYRTFHRPGV